MDLNNHNWMPSRKKKLLTEDDWIEDFYSDFERKIPGYKRPVDFRARALRILHKNERKPFHLSCKGNTTGGIGE